MKIHIDIGHPAHVHYFKNAIKILENLGHKITVSARERECVFDLLRYEEIRFFSRGKGKDSFLGKLAYMLKADLILYTHLRKNKPDIFLSFGSPYAAQTAWLIRKPHIAFDDTEHAKIGQLFYYPFTKAVYNPSCYLYKKSKKQNFFNGYMELCYLHPQYFTPDKSVRKELEIKEGEKYFILRFVSWSANHDIGLSGINFENKIKLVKELLKGGKVFISSENELPKELEYYRFPLESHRLHHALAFASLLVGESATMASEAAILGVPAIFIDDAGRGYTDELEKAYNIVYNFTSLQQGKAIEKAIKLSALPNINNYHMIKEKIIFNKIDVTKFIIDVILKNS